MKPAPLHPVVADAADYRIMIEIVGGALFVHSDVWRWTATARRAWAADLRRVARHFGQPLFAAIDQGNARLAKFCQQMGFRHMTTLPGWQVVGFGA